MSNKKLEIKDVEKSFGNKRILENINFEVCKGEFLSILGSSGCGKTTLLRILIGLMRPDNGIIYKDGIDITHFHPSKRGMGIVFQNYALFENMTIFGNVEYALKHSKESKLRGLHINSKETVLKVIEQVGLIEHIDKKPGILSGGQQQRVAIARTLALNPDIILFDEPMSALDVDTRLSLRTELKQIQSVLGTTMIYITHDQEEAFAMSDRIMVMGDGKIHQIDTPQNIIDCPADAFVENFVLKNLKIKIDSLFKYVK